MKDFLKNLDGQSTTLDEIEQPFTGITDTMYHSFVVEQRSQVVGVVVLEKCTNSQEIMNQFDVDVLINLTRHQLQGKYAILRRLVLNPLFDAQARWVVEVC